MSPVLVRIRARCASCGHDWTWLARRGDGNVFALVVERSRCCGAQIVLWRVEERQILTPAAESVAGSV